MSNVVKPARMDLIEWQNKLRVNAAETENLNVVNDYDEKLGGCFRVMNPTTRGRYEVFYYGEGHPLNRCNCMDFRTSRLATCKHIEAVKKNLKIRKKGRIKPVSCPDGMSLLYVDYSDGPRFAIYYGDSSEGLKELAKGLFDRRQRMPVSSSKIGKLSAFIEKARNSAFAFQITEDARELLAESMTDCERIRRLNKLFNENDSWLSEVFCPGISPYQYQTEGIEFAAKAGRCIIADEMGLGKTIQAIGTSVLLNRLGYVSSVLIVCPTSLKYQWLREIRKFCGKDALVVEGNPSQRQAAYRAENHLFKIVSYNAMSNDMKSYPKLPDFDMVIMDEVQRLKNWNTQAARAVRKLKSEYRVILTGTPLENKLEDLYSIVQLVNQNVLGPYYEFRNKHILSDATGKVKGYRGLNLIADKLSGVLIRRRKAEVGIQLPGRMDKNLFVAMTPQQRDMHEEFRTSVARIVYKWQKYHFLSETDRRRLMLLLSQMRMVCDSTYILDQNSRYDTKVDEVLQIISDVVAEGDEKLVVFSQWERMTRLIAEGLDKAGIGYANLNGSIPSAKRKELIDEFTDNPEVRVFISTDAGSTGLNLQAASYVINIDLPWNPAVLEQRIGRAYRIGQERKIQVINMIAPNSIEEQMLSKLQFKASVAEGVLDGGSDEVSLGDNRIQQIVDEFDFSEPADKAADTEDLSAEEELAAETEDLSAEEKLAAESEDFADETEVFASEAEKVAQDDGIGNTEDTCERVIRDGTSFFEGLTSILADPEQTVKLIDRIVDENPENGELSVKLPIKGKQNLLSLIRMFTAIGK